MAKKQKKRFQKNQLRSLFQNGNYQKVISKIKQFEIDGMSAEELLEIQISSYKKLASSNFELGDINRALRDIESLLSIDDNEEYKLTKLKYLCYIEYFNDAMVFSKNLMNSKNSKIKKEAAFLLLLSSIYSGNYNIDEKILKLLPTAKVNYILGFVEFVQDNTEQALMFFDKCNPRAKVEKENIYVIKSIIMGQNTTTYDNTKPLYRFLMSGDDVHLQNTKNSRVVKREISAQFTKNRQSSDMEKLISLKSSIPIEIIAKETKDIDQQAKLIFNNIVLLVEKQKNYSKALELFIKNKSQLIRFVESGVLFIQIKSQVDDNRSDKLVVSFFSSYLKLHHKKLSDFQLDFIFIFLIHSSPTDATMKLIEENGGKDILFIVRDLIEMKELEPSHQERFNKIIKKYSALKDKSFEGILVFIDSLNERVYQMGRIERDVFATKVSQILTLFQNCQRPHKKYQSTFFKIFNSMASFAQNLDFEQNRALYMQLSETIDNFVEIYTLDKRELPLDIKTLFQSIDQGKSVKKKEKQSGENDIIGMFRELMDSYEGDEGYAWDEDDLDEDDLAEIKEEFIDDLRDDRDPFNHKLSELEDSFYSDTLLEFILDIVAKAIEFKRNDDIFTQKLLLMMEISMQDKEYRDQLIISVEEYAKKDIETASFFLYHSISLTPEKDRETVWFLKWLESYAYLIDDYNQPKDDLFKGCLGHFIRVQQKKRFKTLNARFEKFIDRFKDKGLF